MARENPQKQVEAAQISERRREGEPQPKGGGANRSRLPTPTQLTARRPSPPAPPSARRPPTGGGGATVATPRSSQLRLPTLSSAACADTTPRNFSRTASTPRGGPPPTAAQAQRSSGTHLAQACPGSSSSYRDALVTPRAAGSSLPPQPQTERRQIDVSGGIAGSGRSPHPAPPAGLQQGSGAQQAVAARQEESRLLAQQQARAGHEEERLKQQISRLESGLAAQQQQLQSRLAAVQMLSERREAVVQQLAALQQLCMQAQAVEEGRRAEVQHLGLAADAVRLALEQHRARDGASVSRLAAARSTLLHMMQSGAHALRLPALAASLQRELAQAAGAPPEETAGTAGGDHSTHAPAAHRSAAQHEPAGSATAGAPAAASATKPAARQQRQQQQQPRLPRPASPAGSLRSGPASSCSEWVDSDSCSSCSSLQAEQEAGAGGGHRAAGQLGVSTPTAAAASCTSQQHAQKHGRPLPPLQLAGLASEGGAEGAAGGRGMRRPGSSRIPGASLLSPPPLSAATPGRAATVAGGACESGGSLSPEVLVRLHSIQSKLEAALADQALEVEPSA
ncbi:hypothetical protein ABPG77_007965 [Micractinium sp. CCAP 211/92]